jgi:cyclic pyranopterin monophosphate synthase
MKKSNSQGIPFQPAKMIDISEKPVVRREAVAEGTIDLKPATIDRLAKGRIEKGDALQIASVGGLQAVKSTPNAIMMCHPVPIESSRIEFVKSRDSIRARATVVAKSKTGVEMEALLGVSVALLNIWDVVKKYEKDERGQYPLTRIRDVHIVRKSKEGSY